MPKLFEDAFHNAAIGMAIVSLEGRFIRVNRAYSQIVGYSEAELLSSTFQVITHPEDLGADLSSVEKMISGEISAYQMDKRYIRKDGSFVWVQLSVSFPPCEDGSTRCFFAQAQDITARKVAEACLLAAIESKQRLYDELRQATEEVAKLQGGIVTMCAWTKQIRCGNEWKSVEQFLGEHLHIRLSHGISEEIAGRILSEMEAKREEVLVR
jgi:PAS domain S-box-containing protein